MSREQRRLDRRQQRAQATPSKAGRPGAALPSRRTPVRVSGGSRLPVVPVAIVGGVVFLVLLMAYLIYQAATGGGTTLTAAEKAEANASSSIPGTFYPTQGRGHFSDALAGHVMRPFCAGVPVSDSGAKPATPFGVAPGSSVTPQTPTSTSTPTETPTPNGSTTPNTTPTVPTDCYSSNPPSSGQHLNVLPKSDLGNGVKINIPPDPNVYPPDVEIPRDAIPHLLEHAGVFVGYNCADGDSACQDVVKQLTDLVNNRIDNHNNRVVLAHDSDLLVGTIGMSSWTRALDMPYKDYDKTKVENFIATNACRFNPEKFPC